MLVQALHLNVLAIDERAGGQRPKLDGCAKSVQLRQHVPGIG